jgi:hypothetical protein
MLIWERVYGGDLLLILEGSIKGMQCNVGFV